VDAGVTERFDGVAGRVVGLLSSEGRLELGAGGSVDTDVRFGFAGFKHWIFTRLRWNQRQGWATQC
jgi:hypothetical protein